MFRCITKLKGFFIDADRLTEEDLVEAKDFFTAYKFCFMTTHQTIAERISSLYGNEHVVIVEGYQRIFGPTPVMHGEMLKKMDLQTTEMVYLSRDLSFLRRAMAFCSGTIWITESVSYKEISVSPDVIFSSILRMIEMMQSNNAKFGGESAVSPHGNKKGMIYYVDFCFNDQDKIKMLVLGRYFSYTHYMSQNPPYSTAIYLNKREGSKAFGAYNHIFKNVYAAGIRVIQDQMQVAGICSVPAHMGKANRFKAILEELARDYHIENLESRFQCIRDYPTQKGMSSEDRKENITGAFAFQGSLRGGNVVLIDDIVTTGSTLKECIRMLYAAGAGRVTVLVLAVNQYGINYWRADEPKVYCPSCKSKMQLLINSHDWSFFYFCRQCKKSISYENGWKIFYETINAERLEAVDGEEFN